MFANLRVVCCWCFLPTPLTFVCNTQDQNLWPALKSMCHWEGSAEHRYFWICGCFPLPPFTSPLSPSSCHSSCFFLVIHRLFTSLANASGHFSASVSFYHMKLNAVIGCFCCPSLFKVWAVFLSEEVQGEGRWGAEVVRLPRQEALATTLWHMPRVLLLPALWLFWLWLKSLPRCRQGWEANATVTPSPSGCPRAGCLCWAGSCTGCEKAPWLAVPAGGSDLQLWIRAVTTAGPAGADPARDYRMVPRGPNYH